jgi:hypothetical protein
VIYVSYIKKKCERRVKERMGEDRVGFQQMEGRKTWLVEDLLASIPERRQ